MNITVAVTGMNARADNPGPGLAIARCLKESNTPTRVIGLGYAFGSLTSTFMPVLRAIFASWRLILPIFLAAILNSLLDTFLYTLLSLVLLG